MIAEFFKLLLLSLACGSISMTISKSKFFQPLRARLKSRGTKRATFIGEGLSCPYCVSHWTAYILMLIYFPRPLSYGIVFLHPSAKILMASVDLFVGTMIIVALSSVTARVIFSAYSAMTPPED